MIIRLKIIKKFSLFSLLIFLILALAGCNRTSVEQDGSKKLSSYKFKINDFKKMDKILAKQEYNYATDIDKYYIAVIVYDSKNATVNEYEIDNKTITNINIPKNKYLILSFPANRTIEYTWNIKNDISNGILNFDSKSWIKPSTKSIEKDVTGTNYDRQNFYFSHLKEGTQKLIMRYEHKKGLVNDYFESIININIK